VIEQKPEPQPDIISQPIKKQTLAQVIKAKEEKLEKTKELAPPPPMIVKQKNFIKDLFNKIKSTVKNLTLKLKRPKKVKPVKIPKVKESPKVSPEQSKGSKVQSFEKEVKKTESNEPIKSATDQELSPEEQLADLEYIPFQESPKKPLKPIKKSVLSIKPVFGKKLKKEKVKKFKAPKPVPEKTETRMPRRPTAESKRLKAKLEEMQTANQRPRLEEIKPLPRLYGPIDELANLSLSDFRRISDEPKLATEKLIEKIELLEDDSLAEKAKGIASLKRSPLYLKYSEILEKSILEKRNFSEIIKNLYSQNPEEVLSLKEFNAIMKLNEKLKY